MVLEANWLSPGVHRTKRPSCHQSHLVLNERGAITVLGMVFSMLLIALLFYALGIGRTILAQESMQDAADAASFASAVLHARGMNLIVYINWVMAALLAILITLRLLQSLFAIGMIIFYGLAAPTFGGTLPFATWCQSMERSFASAYDAAKPVVDVLLSVAHLAEKGVAVIVPAIATLGALGEAAESHPPANGAFALPSRISLPVESDSFSVACKRGGELAVDLAMAPLGDELRGHIGDAVGGLVQSMSEYFCGDGKGDPPTFPRTVEKALPEPEGQNCESDLKCAEAAAKDIEALPKFGDLDPCPPDSACEARAIRARALCKPSGAFKPHSYQLLVEDVEVVYRFGAKVIEESRTIKSWSTRNVDSAPCLRDAFSRDTAWTEWDPRVYTNDTRFPRPVCKKNDVFGGGPARSNQTMVVQETHIAHILSCTVKEKIDEPLTEEGETADGGENKSPMRVEQDLVLGGEAFQIRTFAWGDGVGPSYFKDGVKLVFIPAKSSQEESPSDVVETIEGFSAEAMTFLGKISIAQSEYYFADIDSNDPATSEDWMWRAAWTARLRRFRLPSDEERRAEKQSVAKRESEDEKNRQKHGGMKANSEPESSCKSSMSDCGGFTEVLSLLDNLVLH